MHGIFSGIPTEMTERFFSNLVAFDASLPHTTTRISPVTFQTFLTRNGIVCLNMLEVYNTANNFWQKYLEITPGILERVQGKYNLSKCEETHDGWNALIDLLNRVKDVQDFDGHPYYQMHYLSHVCFLASQMDLGDKEGLYYKAIFQDCVSPVLYDHLVPTPFAVFAPIMNYTDIRFNEGVTLAVAKSSMFIHCHSGGSVDPDEFDKSRLKALKDLVEGALKAIVENKNNKMWTTPFQQCLASSGLLNADYNCLELKPAFEANHTCCGKTFKWLNKMRARNEKGLYNDDPEAAIDDLLDIYSSIKEGYEHYNMSIKKKEEV